MTLNLTDSEVKNLVKNHVQDLVSVDTDRLKVTFTKRGTQIDTSIEILKAGEAKSIIDTPVEQPDVNPEVVTEDEADEGQSDHNAAMAAILK